MAGYVAHLAATGLVESTRFVDAAPWLVVRVPAPAVPVVIAYYGGWMVWLWLRGPLVARRLAMAVILAATVWMLAAPLGVGGWGSCSAWPDVGAEPRADGRAPACLSVTFLDVGQADAALVPSSEPALAPRGHGRITWRRFRRRLAHRGAGAVGARGETARLSGAHPWRPGSHRWGGGGASRLPAARSLGKGSRCRAINRCPRLPSRRAHRAPRGVPFSLATRFASGMCEFASCTLHRPTGSASECGTTTRSSSSCGLARCRCS